MWYVIQTMTGKEEELVQIIHKLVPHSCYEEVFLIKKETVKKKSGEGYEVFDIPLFPSYIFAETKAPEILFYQLKNIPRLTKLLKGEGAVFLGVSDEEQEFLENIQGKEKGHLVRQSYVEVDEMGQIVYAEGAVGTYQDKIVKQRLRKRHVWIEQKLLGETRRIMLDIKLKKGQG